MPKPKEKSSVFPVECPHCSAHLWVDSESRSVIDSEKSRMKKSSLDDLLLREKKKKEEADRRFAATAELAKERQQKAKEAFEKALTEAGHEKKKTDD